jgi:hypothetical protein
MDPHETPLEQAQRHVVEAEARVAHQTALVAELTRDGHETTAAELLLSTMQETLLLMRARLADEQPTDSGNQQ